jgi:hypothetical protein
MFKFDGEGPGKWEHSFPQSLEIEYPLVCSNACLLEVPEIGRAHFQTNEISWFFVTARGNTILNLKHPKMSVCVCVLGTEDSEKNSRLVWTAIPVPELIVLPALEISLPCPVSIVAIGNHHDSKDLFCRLPLPTLLYRPEVTDLGDLMTFHLGWSS